MVFAVNISIERTTLIENDSMALEQNILRRIPLREFFYFFWGVVIIFLTGEK